jgi:hypothetical protein
MKKLLIASVLVLAAAGSALAKQEGIPNFYYMALDLHTGKCVLMSTAPASSRYKMMGTYKTAQEANRAMRKASECHA